MNTSNSGGSEMSAHTPGPWKAFQRKLEDCGYLEGQWHIGNGQIGHTVANAYEEANARLIAAAPELLRAMKDFTWNVKHQKVAGYGDSEVQFDASFKQMEAAIAKAEGRE